MRVIQIIIALLILWGLNYYVFYRLWRMIPAIVWGRILLVISGLFAILSPFLSIYFGDRLPLSVASLLYTLGTAWFILLLYLIMIFLLFDLLRLTRLIPVERLIYESRTGFGLLTILLIALTTFGFVRYQNKEHVTLMVSVDKTLAQPLKIVAISDLHLGYTIGKGELEQWVVLINREKPDIVLIAGDVIDLSVRPLYEQGMTDSFKKIKTRYGVYTVLGNHEYLGNVQERIDFFKRAGIMVLRDSSILIHDSFYLVGRDDRRNKQRRSLASLMALLDRSKPVIMLDHQPFELDQTAKSGVGLQISGHTHHGQIWPVSLIVDRLYEQSYGYIKKGDSHIYVSSGLGIWGGKFRIGTRSEYVSIHLRQR